MNCCPACGQPASANYLGLVFDWKGRLVSRQRSQPRSQPGSQPIRLPYSLMAILDALAAGRGEVVSEAILLGAYRAGTATCDRLISKKVSYLRCAIAPLGLGIETVRGKGHRLIEAAPTTQANNTQANAA